MNESNVSLGMKRGPGHKSLRSLFVFLFLCSFYCSLVRFTIEDDIFEKSWNELGVCESCRQNWAR